MTAIAAPAFGTATLINCDLEVIHLPSAIQSHGGLLVLSEPDLVLRQASDNLGSLLQLETADLLGQPLALAMSAEALAVVAGVLAEPLVEPKYLPPLVTLAGHEMDAVIHRTDAGLVLELEPAMADGGLEVAAMFRRMLTAVHVAPTLISACEEAASGLRGITGFDRVMIYRFRDDGAGAVIAEDRRADLVAFMGLHYPASDIPQPARRLFVLNPLRVWTSTSSESAAIMPTLNPVTEAPLDMSRCVLRAASPIHLEYLRNMGVGASMALSIVREGALWGLIVCHHETSRYVPQNQRVVLESLGHLLSLQIATKEREQASAEMAGLHDWTAQAFSFIHVRDDLFEALQALGARLLAFVPATGVAVHVDGRTFTEGTTPAGKTVAALATAIAAKSSDDIYVTSHLRNQFGDIPGLRESGVCGLLALRVSPHVKDLVMWFRPEITVNVTWAGDPAKPLTPVAAGDRLRPRASFAAWVETVRDQSETWTPSQVDAARAFGRTLSEATARRAGYDEVDRLSTQANQALLLNEFAQRLSEALAGAHLAAEQTQQLVASLERLAEGLRSS